MANPIESNQKIYLNKKPESYFILDKNKLRFEHDSSSSDSVFWKALLDWDSKNSIWDVVVIGGLELSREDARKWATLGLEVGFDPSDLEHLITTFKMGHIESLIKSKAEPFLKAVCLKLPHVVKKYLEDGSNPNATYTMSDGAHTQSISALRFAFLWKDLETFTLLLEYKADIATVGKDALKMAYKKGREAFAPWLIKHGLHKKGEFSTSSYRSMLHQAVCNNDLPFLKFLLKHGADINELEDNKSLIYAAAEADNPDILEWLHERGAKIQNGDTPLKPAIKQPAYGPKKKGCGCAKWLLDHAPSLSDPQEKWHDHPIVWASMDEGMVTLLRVHGAKAPVEYAYDLLDCKNFETFIFLLEHNLLDVNHIQASHPLKRPLFHEVIQTQDLSLIKTFIQAGPNLEICDVNGVASLHLAVLVGNISIVRLLLDAGANVNVQTPTQITALHMACRCHFDENIANLLIVQGANINQTDYLHATAFHYTLNNPLKLHLAKTMSHLGVSPLGSTGHAINDQSRIFDAYKRTHLPLAKSYLEDPGEKVKNSKIDPLVKQARKEAILRIVLAHIYDVGGYSPVSMRKTPNQERPPIRLEGLTISNWLSRRSVKITKRLFKKMPNALEKKSAKALLNATKFSSSFERAPLEYASRILAGRPTIVRTGYWIHAVNFVFFDRWFVICNRGGGASSEIPIEIFTYNRRHLTKEQVKKMIQTNDKDKSDYRQLIDTLKTELECQETEFTKAFVKNCPFGMQTKGHCQWNNFELAVWVLITLPHMGPLKPKDVKGKIRSLQPGFDKWHALFGTSLAKKYLNFHLSGTSPYVPDTYFIDQIIANAHSLGPEIKKQNLQLKKQFPPKSSPLRTKKLDPETDSLESAKGQHPTYHSLMTDYLHYSVPARWV